MKKVIIGSIASAIVLMMWGNVYWMLSGIPEKKLHSIQNEDAIISVLKENLNESGRYLAPWLNNEASANEQEQKQLWDKMIEKHKQGPLVTIIYSKEGLNPMEAKVLVMGFAHCLLSSLFLCIILWLTSGSLNTYKKRFLIVFLIGCFASFYNDFAEPIWFHYPWTYHLWNSFFHVAGWFFSGLVLAAIVKSDKKIAS